MRTAELVLVLRVMSHSPFHGMGYPDAEQASLAIEGVNENGTSLSTLIDGGSELYNDIL